jgi:hypothetical protein
MLEDKNCPCGGCKKPFKKTPHSEILLLWDHKWQLIDEQGVQVGNKCSRFVPIVISEVDTITYCC